MRPRGWLPLAVLLPGLLILPAGRSARANERSALDYLPEDAVVAAGYRIENLGLVFDDFLSFMEMQGSFDPVSDMAELRQWEAAVGVSLRDDLLARVGGELAAAVPVDDLDRLFRTLRYGAPDVEAILGDIVFVAGVREPAAFDEALRAALASAGLELVVAEDGLHSVEGMGDAVPPLRYRYQGDLAVAAFSRQALEAAIARGQGRGGLSRSEDFGRVLTRVGPSPDVFVYLNLPRIRALLDASPAVRELLATDREAARLYERWVDGPGWSLGAGWFTYRTSEGTLRQTLLPSQGPFSDLMGATPLGGMWGGFALRMAPVGRVLEKLSEASSGGKQKKAMADIRSIATAIEMHSIDEGRHPGPSGGVVDVDWLVPVLEPAYIREVPRVDPWGRAYRYWSDGETYCIVSGGADGAIQWTPGDTAAGETREPGADLVFANGSFVLYPGS